MRLALKKTHVGQKFLESHSAAGVPCIRPRRFCCTGPPGRSLKLSDSIFPEAPLSDGQEFVRVSRSSALIQMKVETKPRKGTTKAAALAHCRSPYSVANPKGYLC